MKRQFGTKLKLGRETLRSLHSDELPPAGGLLLPTTRSVPVPILPVVAGAPIPAFPAPAPPDDRRVLKVAARSQVPGHAVEGVEAAIRREN
jgi:hypothetical protein